MQFDKEQIRPITNILGLAVLDSQKLEYSIAYMMQLTNDKFDFTDREQDKMLDDYMLNLSRTSLGGLITKLKRLITVSDGFSERLLEALEARNYLIHRFFSDQAENLLTNEGRQFAMRQVKEKRKILHDCYFFLDPFIRSLMIIRGISPDYFTKEIEEKYKA